MSRRLFCDMFPAFYALSVRKEIIRRHIKNFFSHLPYAKQRSAEKLPCLVSSHDSGLIKRAPGIDLTLQQNKAVNIDIACKRIDGTVLHPGEVFSFWRAVGKTSKRRGFLDGRVLIGDRLVAGVGGGLCNLSNTLHLLALHSPLEVIEYHCHSDALAPDTGGRVPFSSGTSVRYNYVDFRLRNNTDQDVQINVWCENERLYGELRSMTAFPYTYALSEEDHHFHPEGDKIFRISRIYKNTYAAETGTLLEKKLIRNNHSEVMFDHSLLPQDQLR